MTTRVEHMKALKAAWKRAPTGPEKDIAFERFESAQRSNVAKMAKAAMAYLHKAEAALK